MWFHTKGFCQLSHINNRYVLLRSFDHANISSMEPSPLRKGLLRDAQALSFRSYSSPELGANGCFRHRLIEAVCRLYVYRL